MTDPNNAGVITGLYWHNGSAALALTDTTGHDRSLPMAPGKRLALRLTGPRRCIGTWHGPTGRRLTCPYTAPIEPAVTSAQCSACARADHGKALARDAAVDQRTWAVYLACWATDLIKVGITATDRGTDRLHDQGAPAFCWLGTGTLPVSRSVERAVATAGLARERLSRSHRLTAHWHQPDPSTRHEKLLTTHARTQAELQMPADFDPAPADVQHLAAAYSLHQPPTPPSLQLDHLSDSAGLTGSIESLLGRDAIVGLTSGSVLIDLRLLDGWTASPTHDQHHGLNLTPYCPKGPAHATPNRQQTLF